MAGTRVTVELDLDFGLLREQKRALIEAGNDGVVHLIDSIQDQAVGQGVPEDEVFGPEEVES